ncbi:MAG: hypothetical protein ACI9W2_002871 [Gammaproteobacteria bacterium]|jgi:hypothetical protein
MPWLERLHAEGFGVNGDGALETGAESAARVGPFAGHLGVDGEPGLVTRWSVSSP